MTDPGMTVTETEALQAQRNELFRKLKQTRYLLAGAWDVFRARQRRLWQAYVNAAPYDQGHDGRGGRPGRRERRPAAVPVHAS